MMARQQWMSRSLCRPPGLGFAPGAACLVSRCLRELGTQLRCMRLLLFLRLRMGLMLLGSAIGAVLFGSVW